MFNLHSSFVLILCQWLRFKKDGTLHSTALTNGSHLCQVDFGNPNINFCSSRSNIKSHFSTFSPCETFRVAMYMYITSHVHAMSKAPNYSTLKITASHIHSPDNQVSRMTFHEVMELPFKIIHLRKCVFLNRKKKKCVSPRRVFYYHYIYKIYCTYKNQC